MTREEAIVLFEKQLTAAQVVLDSGFGSNPGENDSLYRRRKEMAEIALSALRPVSREQVAKIWPGCDACEIPCNNCESIYAWDRYGKPQECTGCPENGYKNYTPESQFCEFCGRPLTGEAVQMVMERLEALKDGTDD